MPKSSLKFCNIVPGSKVLDYPNKNFSFTFINHIGKI